MVFGLFKRPPPNMPAPVERKAALRGRTLPMTGGGHVYWSGRDSASLVQNGFLKNPIGFRVVRLIAEAAAALPLLCQDSTQRYDCHPLLDIIQRPNMAQGRADLLEALYSQLLLTGNAYLEAALDDKGALCGLYVLRSDRMGLVPGADGWPVAYEYRVGGQTRSFDMTGENPRICHIKTDHPMDDHYGLSPLQAAAMALDVHSSAGTWSKALLDNAARPSGAIIYQGADGQSLTQDQYDRLVEEVETNHQGARNAGRPMLLEGGLDWKPMGFSPSDMEFHQTKEAAARDIAIAFGVPPMLVGIQGEATYANYQEAHRAFYRLTVLPLAAKVTAALSHWLAGFGMGQVELRPDLDQVPALAAERDQQWARVGAAGFLTNEEKRMLLGLPRLPQEG